MKQARKGNTVLFAAGSVTQKQQQIVQLKRELADARAEADILRKAMAYFTKGSR